MEQELELAIRPIKPAVVAAGKDEYAEEVTDRPGLERGVSIASDGRKRSRFQMIAIVTALFVRYHLANTFHVPGACNLVLTSASVISLRCSIRCNHCRNSCAHDLPGTEVRSRLHLDWRRISPCYCGVRSDMEQVFGNIWA